MVLALAFPSGSVAMTVRLADALTLLTLAPMIVCPDDAAVARPLAETVATRGVEDPQDAVLVKSFVVPSVYFPVAVNCWLLPILTEIVAGLTSMLTSAAELAVAL